MVYRSYKYPLIATADEKIPDWIDVKIARSLGAYLEHQANVRPLSKQLDHATRVRLVKQSIANQHHQYHRLRNNQRMAVEFHQSKIDCNLADEIETIPSKILAEMKVNQHDAVSVPSFLHHEVYYHEQFEAVLPPEEFARKVAVSRLIRAYERQFDAPEEMDAAELSKSMDDGDDDDD